MKRKRNRIQSPNGSLRVWTGLRYRISAWLIARGLRFFVGETIIPRRYNFSDDPHRKNFLSFLFATEALNVDLVNFSPGAISYLEQQKSITISTDTAVFLLYVHLTKCLGKVYGDTANLAYFNDILLARGIITFFDDLAHGDIPSLSLLSVAEADIVRRIRENVTASVLKERTEAVDAAQEQPTSVN